MTMAPVTFLRDDRRGSVAVEMALILPLMLILMFGGLEGGYYLWSEHKMLKAVRDGARFAGRQPFDKFDCSSGTVNDSATEIEIGNVTRTGTIDGSGPVKIPGWTTNSPSITISVLPCNSTPSTGLYQELPNGGPIVTVSATLNYQALFSNLGFATTGLGLRATSQAAVMGI